MLVSILHKELEYKVEKFKNKKVGGHAAKDQNQIWNFQLVNKPSRIRPQKVLHSWLINTVYHLFVKNN